MHSRLHWALRLLVLVGLGVGSYFISDDLLLLAFLILVPAIIINLTTDAGGTGTTLYLIAHAVCVALAWFAPKLNIFAESGNFIISASLGLIVIWDMIFNILPGKLKNGLIYDGGMVLWVILPFLICNGVVEKGTHTSITSAIAVGTLIAWGAYLLFLLFGRFFDFSGFSSSSSSSGGTRRATARDVERAWDKCRSRMGISVRIRRIDGNSSRLDVYLDVPQYTDNSTVSNIIQHVGGYLSDLDTDHIHFHY
jgi:hypothetical protein